MHSWFYEFLPQEVRPSNTLIPYLKTENFIRKSLEETIPIIMLPRWRSGKETSCNAGNPGSIPGSGRYPGERRKDGNPWNSPAWRIPWTEESGRLQSTGSQRVRNIWATNTQTDTAIMRKHHKYWGVVWNR